MTILGRLALLFIVVPLVELVLLIQVGRWMGLWPTLGMVVLTGVTGAALARREGLRALTAVQADLARGRIPARPIQDGAAILVGGALLLTPGFLTDLLGFALLVPLPRRAIQKLVARRLRRGIEEGRIQVWTGPGGFGGRMDGPGGRARRGGGEEGAEEEHDLDPDKEIVG